MRKERNAFFQNQNASSYFIPTNNYPQMTNSSSSFYQGPAFDYQNEMESRIAKIERQINRIDNRLTKLESESNIDYNNNMYIL